jgi:hypothetical protein
MTELMQKLISTSLLDQHAACMPTVQVGGFLDRRAEVNESPGSFEMVFVLQVSLFRALAACLFLQVMSAC